MSAAALHRPTTPQPDGVSYWVDTAPLTQYPALSGRIDVDIAIVGAGLVGITTAWLLKKAGLSVAVIEARRAAAQVTGRTTAKISVLHGAVYRAIAAKHGDAAAHTYANANEAALAWITQTIASEHIDCDFSYQDFWLYSEERHNACACSAKPNTQPASVCP